MCMVDVKVETVSKIKVTISSNKLGEFFFHIFAVVDI